MVWDPQDAPANDNDRHWWILTAGIISAGAVIFVVSVAAYAAEYWWRM